MNQDIGDMIDKNHKKQLDVKRDVSKVNSIFETQNKQLLDLLKRYKSPGRFCLDCCLMVLLFGLIAVIVMLIKNNKG